MANNLNYVLVRGYVLLLIKLSLFLRIEILLNYFLDDVSDFDNFDFSLMNFIRCLISYRTFIHISQGRLDKGY